MSWHVHDWSPWETYEQELYNTRERRTYFDRWERRRCAKCGTTRERPVQR